MLKLKNVSNKLVEQTKTCVNCFKEERQKSLRSLFNKNTTICDKCFNDFSIKFYEFKVEGISCLSLYDYDDVFRSRLYQLKGCFDIVLAKSFIESYLFELRLIYYSWTIVFVPSSKEDDEIRGFNHVKEIFRFLKLKELDILFKKENYKQSEKNHNERNNIKNIIDIKNCNLRNKKILLVDDVITTGNTLKTCINLVKSMGATKIKILTLSASKNLDKKKDNMLKKAFLKLQKILKVD